MDRTLKRRAAQVWEETPENGLLSDEDSAETTTHSEERPRLTLSGITGSRTPSRAGSPVLHHRSVIVSAMFSPLTLHALLTPLDRNL